jgi:hypothetical protein
VFFQESIRTGTIGPAGVSTRARHVDVPGWCVVICSLNIRSVFQMYELTECELWSMREGLEENKRI